MIGTATYRGSVGWPALRRSRYRAWLGIAIRFSPPRGACAIFRKAAMRAAVATDLIAVQALRLTVLAAIVWGGSIVVRSVTGALQEVAGHRPVVAWQAGGSR
jgi:hypothetical protein